LATDILRKRPIATFYEFNMDRYAEKTKKLESVLRMMDNETA